MSLTCLMKISADVAFKSCSSESIMSRVKMIKKLNAGNWFTSLTIMASKRGVVEGLHVDAFIDSFTLMSSKLQKFSFNLLLMHYLCHLCRQTFRTSNCKILSFAYLSLLY